MDTASQAPGENLHLNLSRQCQYVLDHKDELIALGDSISSYEDLHVGDESLPYGNSNEKITANELQGLKEPAIDGIEEAITLLQEIKGETKLDFKQQIANLERILQNANQLRFDTYDSSLQMEGVIRNLDLLFADQNNQVRDLVKEREPYQAFKTKGAELIETLRPADQLMQAHEAIKEHVRQKQVAERKAIVPKLLEFVEAAAQADNRGNVQRDSVDIAQPLDGLQRFAEVTLGNEGGPKFWEEGDFEEFAEEELSKAHDIVQQYGFKSEQLRQTEETETAVTEKQTVEQGGTKKRRSFLKGLFGRKD